MFKKRPISGASYIKHIEEIGCHFLSCLQIADLIEGSSLNCLLEFLAVFPQQPFVAKPHDINFTYIRVPIHYEYQAI